MSGREGVLGEPLIEMLDEPPIANEACPQTSANPDAVVLGGIPLDDETAVPGERAGTGTPSASSTPWSFNTPSAVRPGEGVPLDTETTESTERAGTTDEGETPTHTLSEDWMSEEDWMYGTLDEMCERSQGTPLDKVDVVFGFIARIAFAIRFSYDLVNNEVVGFSYDLVGLASLGFVFLAVAIIYCFYHLMWMSAGKLRDWLQEKHSKLYIEHQRISGGQATVYACSTTNAPAVPVIRLPYHKKWCTLNIQLKYCVKFKYCVIHHIKISHDPSALDTAYIALCLPYYATMCGALYYAICGRGRVLGILYVVYDALREDFYWIAHTLELYWRPITLNNARRYRGGYSQVGLDPL